MLNYSSAKKYYKHILWLGEYMLFEYVDGVFVFGVASFTTYEHNRGLRHVQVQLCARFVGIRHIAAVPWQQKLHLSRNTGV